MTHDDDGNDDPSEAIPAKPQAAAWRARYFRVAQVWMLLLMLTFGLCIATGSQAALLFVMYKPVIVLTGVIVVNAVLSAIVAAWRPDLEAARPAVALYALVGLIWFAVWADGEWEDYRRDQIRDLEEAALEGRWEEFEDRLYPWLRSMRPGGFVHIGDACLRGKKPPLELFIRVAEDTTVHPTLRTLVAATCGVEHTRWALANGGSVVPKHGVAPSPLAFARDDEVFALLLAAGATVDQRDPDYPGDLPPLFYAYDAANVRRLHAAGADIFATNEYGNTALYGYAWFDCEAWCLAFPARDVDLLRMKQLLELGLDPNHRNADGVTPLLFPFDVMEDEVRLLLQYGADPYATNSKGVDVVQRMSEAVRRRLREEGLIRPPLPEDENPAHPP